MNARVQKGLSHLAERFYSRKSFRLLRAFRHGFFEKNGQFPKIMASRLTSLLAAGVSVAKLWPCQFLLWPLGSSCLFWVFGRCPLRRLVRRFFRPAKRCLLSFLAALSSFVGFLRACIRATENRGFSPSRRSEFSLLALGFFQKCGTAKMSPFPPFC